MRILHVLAQMPAFTGSGVYFTNIIHRLARSGHHQAAIFACQDEHRFHDLFDGPVFPLHFGTPSLPFAVCGMSDIMPYRSTVYGEMDEAMIATWQQEFTTVLLRARDEFRPEVVVLHHLWMLTSLATDIFPHTPKIGVCHNTDLRQARMHPHLKAQYVTNIHKLDTILSLSESQRGEIAHMYDIPIDQTVSMGGGFDETRFYPAPSRRPGDGPVRIVYAGKIAPSKGILELIAAFRRLCENKTQFTLQLTLVGNAAGDIGSQVEEQARGCGGIRLLPAMPQAELADFLRTQDIFVLPSFYEGIALSAVESLACGLRAVTTDISALRELLGPDVEHSGAIRYVPLPRLIGTDKPVPEDIDAFVARLADALCEQIACVQRGDPFPEQALRAVARHSWGQVIERIETVIREVAG